MIQSIETLLDNLAGLVWGLPMVVLLIGSGLMFTILLRGIQFRAFFHAIDVVRGKYDNKDDPGEISHFKALTTALSATIGLGNIAGVAIAIEMGGPGAVFWMTLAGLVGMVTKYCESSLSQLYRTIDGQGRVLGGPMVYIAKGLGPKFKPLAIFFAFACIVSSFGISNMFQSNQTASILIDFFAVNPWITGAILAIAVACVIIGGLQRIATTTSILVPFMGGIYVVGAAFVILMNIGLVPELIALIVRDAFTGEAAAGGSLGAVIIMGARRACFSNEAGIGSAAIAHCAAATKEPIREGVVAMLGPFIDTVVICNMTALVILISGGWQGSGAEGIELTAMAFDSAMPGFGQYFVPFAALLFAFSTMISWSYYGEMSAKFLTGNKAFLLSYKVTFCVFALIGAVWGPGAVINFSDIFLGLMVVPNLVGVWLLFPKVKAAGEQYFKNYVTTHTSM